MVVSCVNAREIPKNAAFHVDVEMVLVSVNVTDDNQNYVKGLKAGDFHVFEDGVPQQLSVFEEGLARLKVPGRPAEPAASVFILFDTSNRMYRKYTHASDEITDFVRQLDPADAVAIYTFGRNLFRAAPLSLDHSRARAALENVTAGSETAVFDALLLTVRDAARITGRKAIVLFSNGPDTASVLSPSDVATVAQNEGIPIYVVSTTDARQDSVTMKAFQLLTQETGGSVYVARTWAKQSEALASINTSIGSAYTLGYYPKPNPNQGFRHIRVQIANPSAKTYQIRMRSGYDAGSQDVQGAN